MKQISTDNKTVAGTTKSVLGNAVRQSGSRAAVSARNTASLKNDSVVDDSICTSLK